jgi:hypothetical protein
MFHPVGGFSWGCLLRAIVYRGKGDPEFEKIVQGIAALLIAGMLLFMGVGVYFDARQSAATRASSTPSKRLHRRPLPQAHSHESHPMPPVDPDRG